MRKKIAILGSTGSIGTSALDVVARSGGAFEVVALSAGSNVKLLAAQARAFRPRVVSIADERLARQLKALLPGTTKILCGADAPSEILSRGGIDIVLMAISGTECIMPLVESVKKKRRVALANKEALISAGQIVTELAAKSGAEIIPVDSEHSAIFQCVDGRREYLSKIYLTGSGGPLLNVPARRFDSLRRRDVLNHPRWKMGRKITVDSATMMNKGLEVIEAQYLFGVDAARIEVLIHPEAVIHSMVEFADGAILAQLGVPDMRLPIQYALTYPRREDGLARHVDFTKIGRLTFKQPDYKKFPCLELAARAAAFGGTAPAALCAADEEAVASYLDGRIKFSDIPKVISRVLSAYKNINDTKPSLGDILEAVGRSKEEARVICCH